MFPAAVTCNFHIGHHFEPEVKFLLLEVAKIVLFPQLIYMFLSPSLIVKYTVLFCL